MEELARLAYEAALRALDKQEEVVRELRSRTALVLAAASFSISIAGGAAVRAAPSIGVAAFGAGLASLSVSLYVLLPQPRLRFAVDARSILAAQHAAAGAGEVYRRLVYDLVRFWRSNDVIVARLVVTFRWSTAALLLEIVLLVAALRDTL